MSDEWDEKARDIALMFERVGANFQSRNDRAVAAALREAYQRGRNEAGHERAEGERVAERRGIERAAKWIPIDATTPRDGTWLLLAKIVGHPDHPTSLWWVCRGHWSQKWNNWNDGIEPCGLAGPTHYLLADGHGVRALAQPAGASDTSEPQASE